MLQITRSSPRRPLSHLRKLLCDGEALLARPGWLTPRDELAWEVRVWRCLDRITPPASFARVVQQDQAEAGCPDLLDFDRPHPTAADLDELLRRRIGRRVLTLVSLIEKVEALCEPNAGGAPPRAHP